MGLNFSSLKDDRLMENDFEREKESTILRNIK